MYILTTKQIYSILERAREGVDTSVDLDSMWRLTGYETATGIVSALQKLGVTLKGRNVSLDVFKALCLMSGTEKGKLTWQSLALSELDYDRLRAQQTALRMSEDNQEINRLVTTPNWIFPDGIDEFKYTPTHLQQVARYLDLSTCERAIKSQGVKGVDYSDHPYLKNCVLITGRFFITMVMFSRSRRGLDLDALPPELRFVRAVLLQVKQESSDCKNTLKPKP